MSSLAAPRFPDHWPTPRGLSEIFTLRSRNVPAHVEAGLSTQVAVEETLVIQGVDPEVDWPEIVKRINDVMALGPDWDSHGARRTTVAALRTAVALLNITMDVGDPAPWVGPHTDGGLLLQWDVRGKEVEVNIRGDGGRYSAVSDVAPGDMEAWEGDIGDAPRLWFVLHPHDE